MRNVLIIMKKELKRFFTDKRMLLSLFLPGVILYIIYSLMGNFIGGAFSTEDDYKYKIGINVQAEQYTDVVFDYLESERKILYEKTIVEDLDEAKQKVDQKELDIFVYYTPAQGENRAAYEIIYNSTVTESATIYSTFSAVLYSMSSTPVFDVTPSDLATDEDVSMMMITMMLPFLMLVFLFSGCMAVSTESIAGEKERGTIATLLITPIKRSHIALGKVFALSITSLVSSIVSFVCLILSLPNLMSGAAGMAGEEMGFRLGYGVPEYLGLLLIIMLTVILFTVLLSIISTFAKSIKEASSYAVPVMVVVMVIGISGMLMGGGEINPVTCLIPIYNTVACMGSILSYSFNPLCLLFTVVSNVVVIGLGILLLAKMFNSERIMFNK